MGHALLIVGYNAERKRFVAVDPSPRGFQGDTVRTYDCRLRRIASGDALPVCEGLGRRKGLAGVSVVLDRGRNRKRIGAAQRG